MLCLSEHGRTPKLSNVKGGGRDHWSQAYSALLAGGGVARGNVVGRTDKIGGDVADRPVSPKDVLATMYHLLGIDPETTIEDRTGRPLSLVPGGSVLTEASGLTCTVAAQSSSRPGRFRDRVARVGCCRKAARPPPQRSGNRSRSASRKRATAIA